mgnify:CR=1 FL=1
MDKIYFFVHIPHTAGTTIVTHIKRNFKQSEYLELQFNDLEIRKRLPKHKDYLDAVRNRVESLSGKERDEIKIVFGHVVPWGIHKSFKQKAHYVTFLRDPISRAISTYNFHRTRYFLQPQDKNKKDVLEPLLLDGRVPEFSGWLKKKWGRTKYKNVNQKQIQFLKNLGYLNINEKGGQELFKKFYKIGFTEYFDDDALPFYKEVGIEKFFIRQNVSIKYTKPNDERARVLATKILEEDIEFYDKIRKIKMKTLSNKKHNDLIKRLKKKRMLRLPFTQIIWGLGDIGNIGKTSIKKAVYGISTK